MSGPQNISPRRTAVGSVAELETLIGGGGWADFQKAFAPAAVSASMDPGDELKKAVAGMYQTDQGRKIIDWLLDQTCRAPYPITGQSMEDLAYAAAKHQARAAVGEMIVKAIVDGRALIDQPQEPNR